MSKVSIVHYNQPGFDFDQFLAFSADAGGGPKVLQSFDIVSHVRVGVQHLCHPSDD